MVADHLSHLSAEATGRKELPIDDFFPDGKFLAISHRTTPWYDDLINIKVCGVIPTGLSYQQQKRFISSVKYYVWEEPLVCKLCEDGTYRRCLSEDEVPSVLHHWHALTYGGHVGSDKAIAKVLQPGFYWPTLFKDVRTFIMDCDRCQRTGNISKRHEMPQSGILEVDFLTFGELTL